MQVAAIKKQQQANQAQGYGEGGFIHKGIQAGAGRVPAPYEAIKSLP